MKISTRLRLAIFIPALMALAIIIVLVFSYQGMAMTREAGDTVRQVRSSITELNHFVFSYILYHEERPKQQFLAGHDELTKLLASAQIQTQDQQRLLDNIRDDSVTMKDLFLQLVSNYESVGTAGTQELQGTQDRLVGLLLLRSYEADADAASLRSLIDDGIRINETRTIGLIFLVIVLATIPLTIVLVRTRWGITSSLSNLSKGVAVIGSGNLDHKIEEEGNDEIGDLSHAFNQMTTNLKTVTASKTDLEREIEVRKRVESELRNVSAERQLALDAARMGWWQYDPITRLSRWDERYKEIFGFDEYEKPNDEILATRLHPEDLPGTWEQVEAALDTVNPRPYSAEYRINLPDGSIHWIEAHGTATFEGTGKDKHATSLIGTVLDITERKKAEEEIQNTLSRFYSVLTDMPLGILLVTPEGLGEFANQAFCDMFNLKQSPASLKNMSSSEIIELIQNSYLYPEKAIDHISEIVGKLEPVKDEEIPMSDGRTFLRDFVSIQLGEKNYGRLWIHRDITERKKAEEALRETRDYLDNLFNYANAPIIVWNPDFEITRFNHAFERLTGRTADEVLGKKLDILFPDDSREASMDFIRKTATGERWDVVEIPILHRDGTMRVVLWNSAAVYAPDGKTVVATIAQGQDITERKKAEEELKRSNTELEASNKELEAFSYSVSHDLRAPLRSMEGFSSALLEDYADKLGEQGKQYLKYVQESSDLMGHLIDDLLKLSRVTRSEMNYETVSLSEMAQKILTELQKTEPDRQVTLDILPDITAYGDRNLLRLVLENLLGNAWKFSSKTDSPRIEMGVTMHNGKQTYFIRDNGVGFDMTYADKLFKPFQRLHKASEFAGTGIGLATVQRIIRRHGGEVWAESKVGEGAIFYFTIG